MFVVAPIFNLIKIHIYSPLFVGKKICDLSSINEILNKFSKTNDNSCNDFLFCYQQFHWNRSLKSFVCFVLHLNIFEVHKPFNTF